jgi:CubicO group peptidase (beta-lactamase class C family)
MKLIKLMWTIPIALCLSGAALADDLTTSGDPKSLGFSTARLARIAPWYQARFDSFSPSDGLVPGAVVAIAKGGKLAYLQAIGFQDRAKTIPMKTNSIFWIASMSKPVTSVAAMILVDDGKLDLDAPVTWYLPELQDMRVAFRKTDPATGKTEYGLDLPKRPMTVRDLLRHTSGLIYPDMDFAYPERGLADATADSGIWTIHMLYGWRGVWRRDKTLADFVSSLAALPLALPLAHQPGAVHEYGWSTEVLSRVVEVASGQSFDQFLQSRIFAPLHMVDTGFYVPEEKLDRLVDSPMPERPPIWDITTPPKLFSGDGGLVSTAPDYLRFCQMLLNDGELDGVRLLTPQAVKEMTTNALPPDIRIFGGEEVGARAGTTFGLGFAIRTDPVHSWVPGEVGSFSWAGLWGTYFWIDPAAKLIGIQMIQAAPGKGREAVPFAGINHLAYGALTIAGPSSFAAPAGPTILSPEALADYVGTYDFGASVSSRDRQGLADGKTGWLGIEAFVAMEQEGLRINRPDPGGPAAKAGVTAGDLITELDDAPLKGLSLADVLAKLRGPANTTIKMKIVHKGQDSASDLSVVRAARRVNAVQLQVRVEQGKLVAEATGAWPILEFEKGKATPLLATSGNEFTSDDEDHTRIAFVRDAAGKVSGLILNPGPWEQKAAMIAPGPS